MSKKHYWFSYLFMYYFDWTLTLLWLRMAQFIGLAWLFIFARLIRCLQLYPSFQAELIMELPAEVTLCEALHVRCCVRVLRVERAADGVTGIAVQITDFDFLAGA